MVTQHEVNVRLSALQGVTWIMAHLLSGAGLRLLECLRLRVKDIDFEVNQIVVREGKGNTDRVTRLPVTVRGPLATQVERVRTLYPQDLERGLVNVYLPDARQRKDPQAAREWGWPWVFPASALSIHPRCGEPRRHHLNASVRQRAITGAARTVGLPRPVSCHSLRHACATHLPEDGDDMRTIQERLGHRDVSMTMLDTHVLNRGGRGVHCPADRL